MLLGGRTLAWDVHGVGSIPTHTQANTGEIRTFGGQKETEISHLSHLLYYKNLKRGHC